MQGFHAKLYFFFNCLVKTQPARAASQDSLICAMSTQMWKTLANEVCACVREGGTVLVFTMTAAFLGFLWSLETHPSWWVLPVINESSFPAAYKIKQILDFHIFSRLFVFLSLCSWCWAPAPPQTCSSSSSGFLRAVSWQYFWFGVWGEGSLGEEAKTSMISS